MLPKNSQSFFGKGTAGEVWKSMLAEKLGAQIASSNQVGLAKQLAAGRSGAPAPALARGRARRLDPDALLADEHSSRIFKAPPRLTTPWPATSASAAERS